MSKIIPIKTKKKKVKRNAPAGTVIEEGNFGKLKYKVFKRGNIHIFDTKETLLFKKDCEVFEAEVDKLNLNSLKEGDSKRIEGCGENDTLIFSCKTGDIEITLEKRAYGMLKKLKKILQRKK